MKYTSREVIEFVQQEEVQFIRLAFCNVYGKQHNVVIMPSELPRAFAYGIAIDASAIDGFGGEVRSGGRNRARWCGCSAMCSTPMGAPSNGTPGVF